MDLYDHPRYYEIAFSFRDIPAEVDLFEECFQRYARLPVRRVLELACGPAPHLEELGRRGYEYVGLDINPAMLRYARQKAAAAGVPATFVQADICDFSLDGPVDFAYVMLGSLYVRSAAGLRSHFAAVARALRPGGLYLLDWCIRFRWGELPLGGDDWAIEREGVSVDMRCATQWVISRTEQTCQDKLSAEVNDGGRRLHLETEEVSRLIFPQEFLLLVELSGAFEFVGWWNHWDLGEPIDEAEQIDRPIALIRRLPAQ